MPKSKEPPHQCDPDKTPDKTDKPDNSGEPKAGGSESGEPEPPGPPAKECTCGQGNRGDADYKPCVHDMSLAPVPDKKPDPNQPENEDDPDEPEEDECDLGEVLRQILEDSQKELIRGSRNKVFKNIDPDNYKKALSSNSVWKTSALEKSMIDTFNEVEPFNWERLLSSFLKTGSKIDIKFSRKRRDRRFGTRPGIQIIQKKHVAFVIDTSGSMDTEKIMSAKPILDSLAKQMDVTIIHCDYQVRHCEKWKPRDFMELKGGGGTLATPAIKMCQHLRVDGMIYYTDGLFADSRKLRAMTEPVFDSIWLLVDARHYGLSKTTKRLPDWGRRVIAG